MMRPRRSFMRYTPGISRSARTFSFKSTGIGPTANTKARKCQPRAGESSLMNEPRPVNARPRDAGILPKRHYGPQRWHPMAHTHANDSARNGASKLPSRFELLTLGDELLLGLTANGHLTWIGAQLGRRGVLLDRNVTVTDEA